MYHAIFIRVCFKHPYTIHPFQRKCETHVFLFFTDIIESEHILLVTMKDQLSELLKVFMRPLSLQKLGRKEQGTPHVIFFSVHTMNE